MLISQTDGQTNRQTHQKYSSKPLKIHSQIEYKNKKQWDLLICSRLNCFKVRQGSGLKNNFAFTRPRFWVIRRTIAFSRFLPQHISTDSQSDDHRNGKRH